MHCGASCAGPSLPGNLAWLAGVTWPGVSWGFTALLLPCRRPVLATGAMLVDLPGVRDANAARGRVAESYLKARRLGSVRLSVTVQSLLGAVPLHRSLCLRAGRCCWCAVAKCALACRSSLLLAASHFDETAPPAVEPAIHRCQPFKPLPASLSALQRCNAIWVAADITRAVDN